MTHKIMVVDDNSATRRMVRVALQRKGHEVVEAADGKTARALMASERPRVVLQDLMLPDVNGFELVGELRVLARGSDVSILAFSGFVSELDEARASNVGFDDIIPKPIAPSHLVPLIEAHLPSDPPSAARFGAGHRVVVADDDPMQLKLATFRLARLGFEVEAVGDGHAALAAIRRRIPDVIVSDVMMPELDGFGLAMTVRQDPALQRLPIVLITSSYVEPADRALARRAGATELVARTPELGALIETLRGALHAPRAQVPAIDEAALPELEKEHTQRVLRQLERQVLINTGLAKRCSALASELAVLAGISEAVLEHRNIDVALDDALAECLDAGGLAFGALYLLDGERLRVRRLGASSTAADDEALASFFGEPVLLRELIARGETLAIPADAGTMDEPGHARAMLHRARATAMVLVPIGQRDRPLGSLLMVARGRELVREDWLAFAHGVAVQITHVLTLARAFADREDAERRATAHAALLDAVIESAPDHVFHIDLDGRIRFANRTGHGFTAAEVIGKSMYDFVDRTQAAGLRAAFERVIATGEPQAVETMLRVPDGTPRWFSSRLGPIRQHGELVGVVLISRDVTDAKQTEMRLMVADRMASVGTLAAGVAHEINNPLASVIANLDMALQDLAAADPALLPGELGDELRDARAAADRVREIVRDLKIFSRGEAERRGPVDVEHVLDSTLRMAWNELRHRARIVKRYGDVPRVDANESRLGQVFLNLIINAAHAIAPGNYESNQIRITTSVDAAGDVVIAIADTGAGIPPEVRARLFTPFFTTKPVGVGTGLGLAISHKIVSQLDGTIAYDTEVGRGTEFRVTLHPAGDAPPRAAHPATEPVAAPRRGRILIIDDEERLAAAIRRFLGQEHDATAVFHARDAIELIEGGERFDLILCDLMMPQVTGMEFYEEVVRLDPSQAARIVFLTGGAFTASAREFLDRVPNRRLDKPFELLALRDLVNALI